MKLGFVKFHNHLLVIQSCYRRLLLWGGNRVTGLNPLLLAELFYLLLFGVAQTIVFYGRSVLVDLCHVLLASL